MNREGEVGKSESPEDFLKSEAGGPKSEDENNSLPAGQAGALEIPHSEIKKSEIENPKCEINMEVHHHPDLHHEKKPWKEYFLEFLMIFLAVTMGFFAENLREKITDSQKIHEYMQSMVSDLQSDITLYRYSVSFNRQYGQMIDTIITSFTVNKNNKAEVYFMARTLTMGSSVIAPNAKTFEQMKSSGTMRLVGNQRIADSIASYYQWSRKFDYWSEMQRQRINDILNVNDKIFDAALFYSIAKEMRSPKKSVPNLRYNPKLISSDPVLINSVLMRYQYYYGILNIMNQHALTASSQASLLIKLLKKEYHLENE
jgi:hypothetical protein